MPAAKFYEGQEFHNPSDPSAPVLVYRAGKFLPKDAGGGAPTKAAPEDSAALKTLTEEASMRQHLAQRAQKFIDTQREGGGTATGPIYGHIDLPFLGNVNPMEAVGKIFNPKLADLDSINNQTWPELRPIGSGPMRNTEVSGFKTAFPSTANYGTSNDAIAKRLQTEAAEVTQKAKFVSDYVRQGKGSAADALAAFTAAPVSAPDARASANAKLRAKSASKVLEPADYLK